MRANTPLEPEEYVEQSMPWVFEQLRLGEQPLSVLFSNQVGYANIAGGGGPDGIGQDEIQTRLRKQAFGVLKGQVSEARVGIQKDAPLPDLAGYRKSCGATDYAHYACDMVQHYADTQLSYKVDFRHSTSDPCSIDRVLTTLHRLVGVSAPYQRFLVWLFQLARWDNPKVSTWWCVAYFTLLYYDMLALSLCLAPAFLVVYHRLRPSQAYDWLGFERPETSLIPAKVFQDAASGTIAKGLIAGHVWGMWNQTLGTHTHIMLADVTDWMERMKNCVTWKRPWASRVMVVMLACMGVMAYLLPPGVLQKLLGTGVGVQFFILAPLQFRHPRYRRMMWIVDLVLWHSPSDVELAVDMFYGPAAQEHAPSDAPAPLQSPAGQQPQTRGEQLWAGLRTLAADMQHAFNPFAKERGLPVMVLQTASSAALDLMDDDVAGELGLSDVINMGKKLGKSMLGDSTEGSSDEDRYTGLGGGDGSHVMSVMCESEEREWAKRQGLSERRTPRTLSIHSFGTLAADCIIAPPADMREMELDPQPPAADAASAMDVRSSLDDYSGGGRRASGASERRTSGESREHRGSLSSWARDISSRFQARRRSFHTSNGESGGRGDSGKRKDSAVHTVVPTKPTLQRTGAMSVANTESTHRHHARHSLDSRDDMIAEYREVARELGIPSPTAGSTKDANGTSPPDTAASSNLELTHEVNKLSAMRNKNARTANDTFDNKSLFAFRCLHQGRYGTLFVSTDQFVFRRSRIMGGHQSSVTSYKLSSVVAIRKAASGIGKSHGVQMLLSSGKTCSFYGLSKRDDIFGFLLVRCGNSHAC
ncbi:hypothetical protein IWQ56_003766 [Coemansia nantahalensis]|nr:hypothetical protein IWQ56_003766 [Coemansia nantahalensis]